MQIHRLSATKIRTAKPGLYADGGGLLLQVTTGPGGHVSRSWIFRFSLPEIVTSANGRPYRRTRDMGLGPLATISLREARELARQYRQLRLQGIDPVQQRKAQRAAAALEAGRATTFDECRDAYFVQHRAKWRSVRHGHEWLTSLQNYVTPVFGKLPVKDIDLGLVIKALEPIWNEKTETATRVRGRIEAILDWAHVSGLRADNNPARWALLSKRFASRSQLAPTEHYGALPFTEVGAFMAKLRGLDGVPARALEFAILTASRPGEVLGARWEEIDPATRTWIVPPNRMKAGREHRVPLSDAALVVLDQMRAVQQNDHVFPGTRRAAVNSSTLNRLLARLSYDVTPHGFRSTFRDWVAERTSYEPDVAEAALAHRISDRTRAAYERGDKFEKRRRLMDAWADYCAKPASISGEVVPLAGRR